MRRNRLTDRTRTGLNISGQFPGLPVQDRRETQWKKGNGTMLLGVMVMFLTLAICLMFAQLFSTRMQGQEVQKMADTVADGTAVYAMSVSGASYEDVSSRAEEIMEAYMDATGHDYEDVTMEVDQGLYEEENTVDVTLTVADNYLFLSPSAPSGSGYTITREAASEFTPSIGGVPDEVPEEAIPSGNTLGEQVARYALQFVGNPYVWGGTSLTEGADCSGFVMRVYEYFGVSLPRTSYSQRSVGTEVAVSSVDDLWPGDILCYRGHVAIYTGNNYFVHAKGTKWGITTDTGPLAYHGGVVTVRRIFDVSQTSTEE